MANPMAYPLCNQTVTVYRKEGDTVSRQVHLQAGDRVLEGIGPTVTADRWDRFVPAGVTGLSELSYVSPQFFQGQFCHIEAGRK